MDKKILGVVILICLSLILFSGVFASPLSDCMKVCTQEQRLSLSDCRAEYKSCVLTATNSSARRFCSKLQSSCMNNATLFHLKCKQECKLSVIAQECLNYSYSKRPVIFKDCNKCTCNRDGTLNCKTDAFCNKNTTVEQSLCTEAGGFYYKFCNGPYFDIVCATPKYCFCEGNKDYTCPIDYTCFKEFIPPRFRVHTIPGWKTLLGEELGDIGVCVKSD